jgi:hypothetical protein
MADLVVVERLMTDQSALITSRLHDSKGHYQFRVEVTTNGDVRR